MPGFRHLFANSAVVQSRLRLTECYAAGGYAVVPSLRLIHSPDIGSDGIKAFIYILVSPVDLFNIMNYAFPLS